MNAAALLDPFATLNPAQRAAVEHGAVAAPGQSAHGPLLVLAGAGSGKTTTLACRVAHLVLHGADPNRILLLTFSRRAASEMQRRVGRTLQQALGQGATRRPPELPWAGTFHSVGARLLRAYAPRIGLSDSFSVHDRGDAEDLMGLVRQELGLARCHQRFPMKGTCLAIYSRAVNSATPLAEVLEQVFPWCAGWPDALAQLFRAYVQAKQQQHALDFDDLLLYWHAMLAEPALAREIGGRFDHVLVDEYQDTNRLQSQILHAMKPDGSGLTVVGDDAQSIYAFRAAEWRNIVDFPARFDPPGAVVTLEQNYRSTSAILDASNAVIGLAAERFTKTLWSGRASPQRPRIVHVQDEAEQACWVADETLARREAGLALKRQAVLFRASQHSAALELELTRRNIPYVKFGGLKFLEAAHVKDLLALLRWAHNPRSRLAGMRVAMLVPGIGPAGAKQLLDRLADAADPAAALQAFRPANATAAAHWPALCETFATLRRADAWPDDVAIARRWYTPHLERLHDDAAVREIDLAQLARLAAGYASRERFLTELTLDPPEATSDESGVPHRDEDYLVLSTLHSAKGQEWSAVSLLNMVDGCMPSDLATGDALQIEEERRLLYVGMTRAKDQLDLLVPQRFYVTQQAARGDRHLYAGLTRFVPAALQRWFEVCGPRLVANPDGVPRPSAEAPVIDIAQRLRGMF